MENQKICILKSHLKSFEGEKFLNVLNIFKKLTS